MEWRQQDAGTFDLGRRYIVTPWLLLMGIGLLAFLGLGCGGKDLGPGIEQRELWQETPAFLVWRKQRGCGRGCRR
jgi:hypothetical protein